VRPVRHDGKTSVATSTTTTKKEKEEKPKNPTRH